MRTTMRKTALMVAAGAAVASLAAPAARATDWIQNGSVTPLNWIDDVNWSAAPAPDAAGTVANFNAVDLIGNQAILLPSAGITVGSISLGDTNNTHGYTFSTNRRACSTVLGGE